MKLFIFRHGETDFNRQGIVQGGGVDSDLNDMGREQARIFFEFYQEHRFDAVYASDLKRTHQTLAPWLEGHGYPLNIEPAIREFSWGYLEGKVPTPEEHEQFLGLRRSWSEGHLHLGVEGGDTPLLFWERLEPAIWALYERHKDQRVLACSHGRTLRILLSQLVGAGMHEMENFQHKNTGLNILHFQEDRTVVAEKINDVQHLEEAGLLR